MIRNVALQVLTAFLKFPSIENTPQYSRVSIMHEDNLFRYLGLYALHTCEGQYANDWCRQKGLLFNNRILGKKVILFVHPPRLCYIHIHIYINSSHTSNYLLKLLFTLSTWSRKKQNCCILINRLFEILCNNLWYNSVNVPRVYLYFSHGLNIRQTLAGSYGPFTAAFISKMTLCGFSLMNTSNKSPATKPQGQNNPK
jgi:hypothetical protein